ncbi:MAG: ribulose-phosphate 3-epimerase [bacterium]|nr:MAG: ribulose-phosphate 3-epimerase [bacterium]
MTMGTSLNILHECSPTLSVGIISADLMSLGSELALLERAGIKVLHFDVMDGCFTPMLTVGLPFINGIKTTMLKDVHLMINDQDEKAADYIAAGADMITIHVEACNDALRTLSGLGRMENANDPARGLIRGAAINPGTEVNVLEPLLDNLEMIVLLAVDPIAGENPTMDDTRQRFSRIKEMVSRAEKDTVICIDGGVKRNNIDDYAAIGADLLVSGSAIFRGSPEENVRFMFDAMKPRYR